MKQAFIEKNFAAGSLVLIEQANEIIEDYQAQGYILTLRQLYYQFVSRDLIENSQRAYKRLGSIVNDARLAGLIDWTTIEDRTRNLQSNWHAKSPKKAIQVIRDQYGIDMWANQPERVEVWIEKEALTGVIEPVCDDLDVPYFACRGYVSQSEQYAAYQRFNLKYYTGAKERGGTQRTILLHFGDHDPSGIDMTRDNADRLALFLKGRDKKFEVIRVALNMDQVEEYEPPPNPAKMTDSRFESYMLEHGDKSWELDALEPVVIDNLIRDYVAEHRDEELWDEKKDQLAEEIETLDEIISTLE